MVYQLRMYACIFASGNICLALVLGRLPEINLLGLHYCVVLLCCGEKIRENSGGKGYFDSKSHESKALNHFLLLFLVMYLALKFMRYLFTPLVI